MLTSKWQIQLLVYVVHIMEKSNDWSVADRVSKKYAFHRRSPNHAQQWNGQKQPAKSGGLTGIPISYVIPQNALGLILKHFNRMQVSQASGLWK